jgi:hypothetical protein
MSEADGFRGEALRCKKHESTGLLHEIGWQGERRRESPIRDRQGVLALSLRVGKLHGKVVVQVHFSGPRKKNMSAGMYLST